MCRHSYVRLLGIPSLCNACHIFIVECGIAHCLCTMCMLCAYLTFGNILIPYATLVPNFISVVASIALLASGEKNAYSITQLN